MNEREDKYAELKACLSMAAMMPCDPRTKQMLEEARKAIEELQAAAEQCGRNEWYGHYFKNISDGLWKCKCGKTIKDQPQ